MKLLELDATESTPEIRFDPQEGILKIKGRSIPENATTFYYPLIDWLREYSHSPKPGTTLDLYLEYINSISQKMVLEIFHIALDLHEKTGDLVVNWYYDEDDEEMMEEGEIYSRKFPFNVTLKPVSIN